MRRRWRATIVLGAALTLTALGAWTQRKPIARDFVDRELARRGVPARYEIAALGLGRQRLRNVVIGDPADPDLVADWVELGTSIGVSGATVDTLSVGRVRMRARWVDGRLSFGAIDRLMPAPSGKPFTLPAFRGRFQDVRLRIEAPQGVVGVKLSGRGRLNDGFAGRLALVSRTLDLDGCRVEGASAAFALRVSGERPSVDGPVRVARAACGDSGVNALGGDLAVTLGAALDRWSGRARLAAENVAAPGVRADQLIGNIRFDGTAQATAGDVSVKAGMARAEGMSGNALSLDGRYRIGAQGLEFAGRAGAEHAKVADARLQALGALRSGTAGTPLGPLAARLADAARAFAGDFAIRSDVEAVAHGEARALRIARAELASESGGRVAVNGPLIRFGAVEAGSLVKIEGGGLPQGRVTLRRDGTGDLAGRAELARYEAGTASLALTPVDFRLRRDGGFAARTQATLSGPLGTGRVEAVSLPIDARWSAGGLVLNPDCAPLAWRVVRLSGLSLDPGRLTLCPAGPALVATGAGGTRGGARIGAARLTGRLGASPLAVAASRAELRLGANAFELADVDARIGGAERATLITATRLTGTADGARLSGRFEGGGGRVGNVPLLLSKADGRWTLDGGRLGLEGALTVSDAVPQPRFHPLVSDDVAFRLADDRIEATGTLHPPGSAARVADVAIEHRLSSGAGSARFDVPGIVFSTGGLQPEQLTPITYGVVADVEGNVAGGGRIDWDAQGVTSQGDFHTDGLNLAAAFGPVTGLKGELKFTDLLGLVSAPGQVATVASINPGIAAENGTIRYQLVGDQRVRIEGGLWPFAGGELVLEPTLLDFDEAVKRRMTFRITAVDAGAFLQQFDFDNLDATGTFDGVLPMVFDINGGRIESGRLAARAGGNLAYVGTVTEEDLGFWGNLAFQALKSLDYRNLDLTLNGPLAGEMVTEIRFAGVSQGEGTKSNFLIRRLAKLPFVFNITVRAPFRQLADSVRSYYDPSRLIERNLPALLEEEERRRARPAAPGTAPTPAPQPIQPSESEKMP